MRSVSHGTHTPPRKRRRMIRTNTWLWGDRKKVVFKTIDVVSTRFLGRGAETSKTTLDSCLSASNHPSDSTRPLSGYDQSAYMIWVCLRKPIPKDM